VSCGGHNCREESEKYEDTMFELAKEEEGINIELGDVLEQCETVKNRIRPIYIQKSTILTVRIILEYKNYSLILAVRI
jgi:hypothetical protein